MSSTCDYDRIAEEFVNILEANQRGDAVVTAKLLDDLISYLLSFDFPLPSVDQTENLFKGDPSVVPEALRSSQIHSASCITEALRVIPESLIEVTILRNLIHNHDIKFRVFSRKFPCVIDKIRPILKIETRYSALR
jgi:hypothetical protein